MSQPGGAHLHSLKLTCRPCKMDAWKTIRLPFWGLFSGAKKMLVFREGGAFLFLNGDD